jgi:hypothetical protein
MPEWLRTRPRPARSSVRRSGGSPTMPAIRSFVLFGLAASLCIETETAGSIKKCVRTTRRYRTVKIQATRYWLTSEGIAKNRTHGAQ